jgi:tetratricopeptide (TPR) repeat protein
MGEFKNGSDVLKKGNRNAGEVNDKYHVGLTKIMHSGLTYFAGYGDSTIEYAQEAIKIYEEADISIGLEIAWSLLGGGYCLRGEYRKALAPIEKSLKLAKELGLPFAVSWCYWFLAMALWFSDNVRHAAECAEEALRISQECGLKSIEGMARVFLGCMVEEVTPPIIKEAQQQITHGISIWEDRKIKLWCPVGYLHLGEFLANAGRKEEALQSLKKAETLYQEMEITPQSHWLTRTKDAIARLR